MPNFNLAELCVEHNLLLACNKMIKNDKKLR